jgi:hypothetical protein
VWKGDVFGQLGFAEPAQLSQILGWVLDAADDLSQVVQGSTG